MVIMKELNIKIIYLLLCIIFIGCHDSVDPKDSYIICFQTSSIQNCYFIKINHQMISTSVGQRSTTFLKYVYNNKQIPLNTIFLDTIVKTRNKKITRMQYSNFYNDLKMLISEKEVNDFYPGGSNDTWGIIILTKGKQYSVEYPTSNKKIDKVIEDIDSLSPIKLFEKKYSVTIPINQKDFL